MVTISACAIVELPGMLFRTVIVDQVAVNEPPASDYMTLEYVSF